MKPDRSPKRRTNSRVALTDGPVAQVVATIAWESPS
jgi:hypothetical protein